jgi:hypothetical protein
MVGLTRRNFYRRYLLSKQLRYVVKTWFHGHRRRHKSFIPRNALLELLVRELCQAARLQVARRGRPAVPRKAKAADLERLLLDQ